LSNSKELLPDTFFIVRVPAEPLLRLRLSLDLCACLGVGLGVPAGAAANRAALFRRAIREGVWKIPAFVVYLVDALLVVFPSGYENTTAPLSSKSRR
jgi:hypothetical protein